MNANTISGAHPPLARRTPAGNPHSDRQSVALATLLAACVLLPLLGHRPLTNWDEGIYAEVSREMLAGNWLVPSWNHQLWLEKPPLMLWVTAVSFKLFGVSEFWARAGSALSGIALASGMHAWMVGRESRLAAWLGTLILLSTFGFEHVCRAGEMDALLSLGCFVSVCGLAQVETGSRFGSLPGWLLFWTGFAIAVMTKGAAAVVLPITLLATALASRWHVGKITREFWLGAALFLVAVLPWHLAMWLRFGQRFSSEYLGYHVIVRAAQAIEAHQTHGWFYLGVLLVSAPPFVLASPWALAQGWRAARLRPFAAFTLVVLVFYSLVRTRLPHYIAPLYAPLAMLTGVWLARQLGRLRARLPMPARRFWTAAGLALLTLYAAAVAATAHGRSALHAANPNHAPGMHRPDERESVGLLKQVFRSHPVARGPLLVWRAGAPESIATSVFYSGRQVEQVALDPAATKAQAPFDRYDNDPHPLASACGDGPHLILLDKSLLPQLPNELAFQPLAEGPHEAVGVVSLVAAQPEPSGRPPERDTPQARTGSAPADAGNVHAQLQNSR